MGGTSHSRSSCYGLPDECTTKLGTARYDALLTACGGTIGTSTGQAACCSTGNMQKETAVVLQIRRFAVLRKNETSNPKKSATRWTSRYHVGRELGAGQTAVVYEAFATSTSSASSTPRGRKVALKRFKRSGTSMFWQEVRAHRAAGIHPHIMRLLEIYEGGDEDDALIMEYCHGGDLYDFYAKTRGRAMTEKFVANLLRQLLAALSHLVTCHVDHRDVKPENLLLYGPVDDLCLKLTDFGWAVVNVDGRPPVVPPEGVGSLWYAPPELNPLVPGTENKPELAPLGMNDMWSVGVIAYLLLVGHSPFNNALKVRDSAATERAVMQLAAKGDINTRTPAWSKLSPQAQNFITVLVRPVSRNRLPPLEALHHPFIVQDSGEDKKIVGLAELVINSEREKAWMAIDGFQRLCWLAIASAISEPELLMVNTSQDFSFQQFGIAEGKTSNAGAARDLRSHAKTTYDYLKYIASELVDVVSPSWFQPQSNWTDIMHLAFHYLDIDSDGVLDEQDLRAHVAEGSDIVQSWILKWKRAKFTEHQDCLEMADFMWALWATCARRMENPQEMRPFDDSCSPCYLHNNGSLTQCGG